MMSKGFIVSGSVQETWDGDYEDYDFDIEDQRVDKASAADGSIILKIDIPSKVSYIALSLDEAKAFVEAMQEIIVRYQ